MQPPGDRDRGSTALVSALGVAAAGIAAAITVQLLVLVPLALFDVRLSAAAGVALITVLTQGVAFGGVALLYLWWRRPPPGFVGVRWPTSADLRWIAGGYLASVLAVVAALGLVGALPVSAPATHQLEELGARHPTVFLVLIPLSFLIIGPAEELLFRGIVQGRLRRGFGPVGAVSLAALLFAAVHLLALTGPIEARLITVTILFGPSLVLGAIYERTGNLVVPAVVHGAYNATLLGIAYAAI
jgi:uncharacterized protein